MAPESGFDKELEIAAIRIYAQRLVGPCSDVQIIFVALTLHYIDSFATSSPSPTLNDVPGPEIAKLAVRLEVECAQFGEWIH